MRDLRGPCLKVNPSGKKKVALFPRLLPFSVFKENGLRRAPPLSGSYGISLNTEIAAFRIRFRIPPAGFGLGPAPPYLQYGISLNTENGSILLVAATSGSFIGATLMPRSPHCRMPLPSRPALLLLLVLSLALASSSKHIVLMLVDEMGTGDVPWSDPAIYAPTIKELGEGGLRLGHQYAWHWCAPTRGALLSGRFPMHSGYKLGPQTGPLSPSLLTYFTLPSPLSSTPLTNRYATGHAWPRGRHGSADAVTAR
jgi:hypothetical protein